MAYATLADLKEELGADFAGDNGQLRNKINDAETFINGQTNRTFEAVTRTRYYSREARDRFDSSIIHINDDDLLTIATLLNGDASATPILAASYWLLDRNDGPPFHAIQLTNASGVSWEWDTDGWVTITGGWGYAANAPNDIRRATIRMAAFFYRKKDSQVFETTAIPEAGVITVPTGTPVDVIALIKRYKRYF